MKPVDDLSIFDREESQFLFQIGNTVVWENRVALKTENLGLSYDPSLALTLFCKSHCGEQIYYQHRLHQLPVTFDFVVSGSCYFRSGKKAILAEAGDLVILPRDCDNAILFLPSKNIPCERYGMIIEGELFSHLLKHYHLDTFIDITFANPTVLLNIFTNLQNTLKGNHTQEHIAGHLFEFLCTVGKYHSHNDYPPMLVEVVSFLDTHLADKLNIHDVAQKFHISIQGLNNLFKKYLQTTAYQYLISQRMIRAKELLTRSENYRINEIAFLCGYEDPLHFSTEFRQFYGKSPRNYRKK